MADNESSTNASEKAVDNESSTKDFEKTVETVYLKSTYKEMLLSEDGRLFKPPPNPPVRIIEHRDYVEFPLINIGFWVCNGKLYAVSKRGKYPIHYFDLKTETWTSLRPLRSERHLVGLAEEDGFVYAVGGANTGYNRYSDQVERYNMLSGRWTQLAPLPIATIGNLVSAPGILFFLSKMGMFTYDMDADRWKRMAALSAYRYSASASRLGPACFLEGLLYVSVNPGGGDWVLCSYDPAKDEWKPCRKTNHTLVSGPRLLNGRILVLSKLAGGGSVLERYDHALDAWTDMRKLPDLDATPGRTTMLAPLLINESRYEKSLSPADP